MYLLYRVYVIRIYEGGGPTALARLLPCPPPLSRSAIDFADPTIVSATMPLHQQAIILGFSKLF